MKLIAYLLLFFFLPLSFFTQTSENKFWSPLNETSETLKGTRQIIPSKFLTFSLIQNNLKNKLFNAPHEKDTRLNLSNCVIELPTPDGVLKKFKVVESPVMAEELGSAYPDIKTFSVKGIDDPFASGKLDWNEFGFHGSVFSVQGDFFIDPYCVGNTHDYITYYTSDFSKDPKYKLPEFGFEGNDTLKKRNQGQMTGSKSSTSALPVCIGNTLRKYRLAVACTGEYAIASTGSTTPTLAQTLSKIVTSINRVDGVYEKEVAIRMVLVANETNIIFLDPSTDPFNGNNNALTLINESQTIITNTIGTANYDIGHTFSTGGGGLAFLGVVCNSGSKARGITGSGNPVGDPYDIDYVAHEIGHQFDANHSFNAITGSCNGNRTGSTAMEPGSGVTIMGYAGICSTNDLASNSIAYFHAVSYDEIVDFTQSGSGNACPVAIASGNQAPLVSGAGTYTIPYSTPFMLTGSGIDPDNDPLTYSWEETDAGASGDNWNSGSKPFFRSYEPKVIPTRLFPTYQSVLNGDYTSVPGEYLPQSAQTLNFRLTARDNNMGGGGVCYSNDKITVANAGPFKVTYPNTNDIAWGKTQLKTITWDINGTDQSPINCVSVNILISYDGGASYSIFKSNVDNVGFNNITVPTLSATINTCRIKIESIGNIFYDISDHNFTISTDVTAGLSHLTGVNSVVLDVWPNPFNNTITFSSSSLNSQSKTEVKISDLLGNVLMSFNYLHKSELKETLDLSSLSSGIYFLNVSNDNRLSVQKIVKD